MAGTFQSLFILCLLAQTFAYRTCHVYHNHGRTVTEIRCSNSEYCCDNGCCRKVYTIWYFWTLLLFGLFVAIIACWWYKAYKLRHCRAIVQQNVIPMQVVQPYPSHTMNAPNYGPPNSSPNNAPESMSVCPPYTAYAFAPPPYSVANSNGAPPPKYYPPHQEPKQQ